MIRKISLVRKPSTDEGTPGHIQVDPINIVMTLELPDRNNAPGISRIPAGTYRAQFTKSPLFPSGTFQVIGVPGREGIRIHIGNWAGDVAKGFASDVEGCILVGNVIEKRTNQGWMDKHRPGHQGFMQLGVFNSTATLARLYDLMGNDPFDLEVMDEVPG